jgi:hypothetical protein
LSRELPGAGRRRWQAEFATVHETHGAEQAAREFAAQDVGQVVERLGFAQAQCLSIF